VLGPGKVLELRDAPVSPASEPVALSEERPRPDEHRPEPVVYAPSPLSEPAAARLADRLAPADEPESPARRQESRGRRREPRPQLGQELAASAEHPVSASPWREPAVQRCSSEWSLRQLEPLQPAVPAGLPRELVVRPGLTCRCQIPQAAPPSFRSLTGPAAIA
jgi:hypothetical protein